MKKGILEVVKGKVMREDMLKTAYRPRKISHISI